MSNKTSSAARTKRSKRQATVETPLLRELARATSLDDAMVALMGAAERERVARLAWGDDDGVTAATRRGPDMDDVLTAAQLALGAEYAAHQYEDVRSKVESDLRSVVTYLADYKRIQARIRRKALSLMDLLAVERPVLAAIAKAYRTGRYGALAKYVPGA